MPACNQVEGVSFASMQSASPWHPDRFSQELKALRRHLGVQQATLAEWGGVSASQISRWHSGTSRPGYDTLRQLLTAAIAERPDDSHLRAIADRTADAAGYPRLLDPDEEDDVEEVESPYTGAVFRIVKNLEMRAEDAGLSEEEEREMIERAMVEAEKLAETIVDAELRGRLHRRPGDE